MTSIVIWKNDEESGALWACSDSRITQSNSKMMDSCSKIFTIPVICHIKNDVHRLNPIYITSIGFAFAGGTLINQNVKDFLSVALSSLLSVTDVTDKQSLFNNLPSIHDIASKSVAIAKSLMLEVGQSFPRNTLFEYSIFGYCHKKGDYVAYHVCHKDGRGNVEIEESNIYDGNQLIMGDKTRDVLNYIEIFRESSIPNSLAWWRAPLKALKKIVENDEVETIGGWLQIALATPLGVNIKSVVNQQDELNYISTDLLKHFNLMGGYIVSLNGMDVDFV
ncbi:hypothetical protein [Photobacterium damselae]|uniref:hypothetical protein n=1 Tax=Photobacterium damselae TaxID=38293 RepID=UPI0010FE2B94|nr:hypothetical protein [Photobacterium damselae]TLS80661.1 hypothetical protein FD721_00545 [Photobacterium damselae subsp. damselae]